MLEILSNVREMIGYVLIAISVFLTLVGIIGVFRSKNIYAKILVAAKIDIVAFTVLFIGAIIRSGISWYSLKALFVLIIYMFLNPIVTSKIAVAVRSDEMDPTIEDDRYLVEDPEDK